MDLLGGFVGMFEVLRHPCHSNQVEKLVGQRNLVDRAYHRVLAHRVSRQRLGIGIEPVNVQAGGVFGG